MNQEELLIDVLTRIGMTPRLIAATEEQIPASIRPLIPEPEHHAIGFSLLGTTGCGKSCGMAWFVKKCIEGNINRFYNSYNLIDYDYHKEYSPDFRWGKKPFETVSWIYWPDTAQKFQNAARDGWECGARWTQHHPEAMKRAKILILDDLGRERCKPDSYATTMFESIVHHRYEYGMITLWNSNLDAASLIDLHGAPTVDRLRGLAPVKGDGWLKLKSLR